MVDFTSGDMFEVAVDARVNTVNCVGAMGAGVALLFKRRYSRMYADYRQACKEGRVRPGVLHIWRSGDEWVINLPTKRHWQDKSRYEDIRSGLAALREYLRGRGWITVTLPALGCGNGGLDWAQVSPMITEYLDDLNAHVLAFVPVSEK